MGRRGAEVAKEILPATRLASLLSALWSYDYHSFDAHRDWGHSVPLTVQLVDLGLQLGGDHCNALLKAAAPFVEKFPVDFRLKSLWRLYQKVGDIPRLREWIKRWLDDDGWLWGDDAASRKDIAERLLPRAREIGEGELANKAVERLRWLRVGYRCHKEYSFDVPTAWFRELSEIEPECWQRFGLRLWSLSEACSASGGDNRSSGLDEAIGAAAWRCGPTDVYQLLTAEYEDCGTYKWLFPTSDRIVGGFTKCLKLESSLTIEDRLAGWCISIGFSRWFHGDRRANLVVLRRALLESIGDEIDKEKVSSVLQKISPTEFLWEVKPGTGSSAKSSSDEEGDLESWLERIERGEEVHPCVASRLLIEALLKSPQNFNKLARTILGAVGVGAPYGWGWGSSGDYHDALLQIGRIVPDDILWELVSSAIRYAGRGSSWSQGICRNLFAVLLARASKHGSSELKTGLTTILAMHSRLCGSGPAALKIAFIELQSVEPIHSIGQLAAKVLTFLLASRSAEVIESVLKGLHALVAYSPEIAVSVFALTKDDPWKRHWVLNAAEVWAELYPREFKEIGIELENSIKGELLSCRLQAWIVLSAMARQLNLPLPDFPYPTASQGKRCAHIVEPLRQIFAMEERARGSIRLVDRNRAAEGVIESVEHALGADLADVRSEVAKRLFNAPPDDDETDPWPTKIRGYGDTRCNSFVGDLILDEVYDEVLENNPLPPGIELYFAQAYLGNEDAFMLRFSPRSGENFENWPSEDQMCGIGEKDPDYAVVREQLHLLATQDGIAEDEMVLAARLQVFTYREDLIFRFWWEEGSVDSGTVHGWGCPTTLSGRTFPFHWEVWWEQKVKVGMRPVAFAAGGHQRLSFSFPEFVPAKMWGTDFGWRPSHQNPLVWLCDGKPIARYELVHGPLRSTQTGHPRQPLIGRWVVKKAAWEQAIGKNSFRPRDDFERFPSNVEH